MVLNLFIRLSYFKISQIVFFLITSVFLIFFVFIIYEIYELIMG